MSDIELFAKLQQGAQLIADACSEYLEKRAPVNRHWSPSKIKWEEAQGSKGPYERSEDMNNPEFKAMLKDLQAHKGKLNRQGYFYWVFENGHTVGRKKRGRK